MVDTEKYIARIKAIQKNHDTEEAHLDADQVLCELLTELGYKELVEEYDNVDKWFA